MEVILSRKRAKSRTRGRKLHLTGTKARVARTRQTRADLEQQLKARKREIAYVREHLAEAVKQQITTSARSAALKRQLRDCDVPTPVRA